MHDKIIRIDIFELAHGHGHCAVAAILWSVLGWLLVEQISVCARLKVVLGSAVGALPLRVSFDRLSLREESDRVVPVRANPLRIDVYKRLVLNGRLSSHHQTQRKKTNSTQQQRCPSVTLHFACPSAI